MPVPHTNSAIMNPLEKGAQLITCYMSQEDHQRWLNDQEKRTIPCSINRISIQ